MLLSFTVKNFLSFNEEQRLSMIASNYKRKVDHVIDLSSLKLLKSSIVYGANASGKTNLVKAVRFMKNVVTDTLDTYTSDWYHKSILENSDLPSRFEVEFYHDSNVFAYGFETILNQVRITSEWLYKISPSTKVEEMIYERILESEGYTINFGENITEEDLPRLNYIAQDLENNFETLFLTEMNRNKKIDKDSSFSVFQTVYNWFTEKLVIISPDQPITNFEYVMLQDNDLFKKINRIMSIFDTGITNIKSDEVQLDEVKRIIPDEIVNDVINTLNKKSSKKKKPMISLRNPENYYQFSKSDDDIKIRTIRMNHGDNRINFDFREESDGTRRLFDLIDIFINIDKCKVYIIDEIDRSLHPNLLYKFLELFYKLANNKRTQLIFTTHESSVMDLDLVRQDEIWFVDRDSKNESKLYSLDIFKVRYDKKIDRAYLEGRYGAIPVFKNNVSVEGDYGTEEI